MSRKIKSRSDLFRGMLIDKPPTALVVGYDPAHGDIYACPKCGNRAHADDCDVCGAEPDCLFCNQCNGELSCM